MIKTPRKDLCFVIVNNEKILVELSKARISLKMQNDYIELNGNIYPTSKNVITNYGEASDYDYFFYFIAPKLPLTHRIRDILNRINDKKTISLQNILALVRRIEEEEKYYTKPTKPIPKERFKELDRINREKLQRAQMTE